MPLVDVELVAAGLVGPMSEGQQVLLVEGRHGQAAGESKLHERSAGRSTDTTACTDPTACTDTFACTDTDTTADTAANTSACTNTASSRFEI